MWLLEVNVLGRRMSCTVENRRRPLPGSARVAQWRHLLQRHSGAAA
ncbi:hypothetical protein H7K45_29240 [Mycobacterium yunnanensis]|uniref:Uncharacterized protein n=1 Tax=Mycobacterium yunnanensis TaxID=368477 RepID=A0A9X2YSF2_9MYCO|nr:hypothetical protein [Mycobacterium yunnanensis]MCV7424633.1 hypothetical protein [Mycobacterium yunnanensis]